ncbi:MAG: hypothetical protein OIN66_03270 [Candidatus Methanoperedens sp.]|nr:hypothetical protein [Candidatus Methanoperedens sp.]
MQTEDVKRRYIIPMVFGVLIINVLVSGCTQLAEYENRSKIHSTEYVEKNSEAGSSGRNYTSYTNNEFNFSIDYPGDWNVVPMKSKITFISPNRYEGGHITLTLQLLSSRDSGGTYNSVDDVISDLLVQYREHNENVSNVSVIYEREEMLSGSKGKELNISYNLYGMNYTQTQIVARGGKFFYVIMYIAQSEHYNEYADVYEYSKRHFRLINNYS